jgi:hypothetical protein
VEGVDDVLLAPRALHQEVSGEGDAAQIHARATPGADVDEGQRDRNSHAALEHLVEVAVTGIEVFARSLEAELVEDQAVQAFDALAGVARALEEATGGLAEAIELGADPGHVEAGVLLGGDQDGPLLDVELGVRGRGEACEAVACVFGGIGHAGSIRTGRAPTEVAFAARAPPLPSRP